MIKKAAERPYERVLVAVDLGVHSRSMLHSANALAPAASLHVLHALSPGRQSWMRAADVPEATIHELNQRAHHLGLLRLRSLLSSAGLSNAQASVSHGDPSRLTLERHQEIGPDLIVMGKHGHATLCNFLLGKVTQQVLASAACDMLIMPRGSHPGGTPEHARTQWTHRGGAAWRPSSLPG